MARPRDASPNCDTVKKARGWLDGAGVSHRFHDFRKDGLDPAKLQGWIDAVGWERLLNKSGTTFRKLADTDKADLDAAKAKALMLDQPAMIRRPVVEAADGVSVGFYEGDWQDRFAGWGAGPSRRGPCCWSPAAAMIRGRRSRQLTNAAGRRRGG